MVTYNIIGVGYELGSISRPSTGSAFLRGYVLKPGDLRALAEKFGLTLLTPTRLPGGIELKIVLVEEHVSDGEISSFLIHMFYSDLDFLGNAQLKTRYMKALERDMPYIDNLEIKDMKIRKKLSISIYVELKDISRFRERVAQLLSHSCMCLPVNVRILLGKSENGIAPQYCEKFLIPINKLLEERGIAKVFKRVVYGEPACIRINYKSGVFLFNKSVEVMLSPVRVTVEFMHLNTYYTIESKYSYEATMKILNSLEPLEKTGD